MSNRLDVAIDLETLSTRNNASILQIGAVAFDIKTGRSLRKFKLNISLDSCLKHGLNVEAQTVEWWSNRSFFKELFKDTIHIKKALEDFTQWLTAVSQGADIYLWGFGINADNTWLKSAYEAVGLTYPIKYRNNRDGRTILELAMHSYNIKQQDIYSKIESPDRKHDALNDAEWLSKLVTTCYSMIVR